MTDEELARHWRGGADGGRGGLNAAFKMLMIFLPLSGLIPPGYHVGYEVRDCVDVEKTHF